MKISYVAKIDRTYTGKSGREYVILTPETATRQGETRAIPLKSDKIRYYAGAKVGDRVIVECEYIDYYDRKNKAQRVYVIPTSISRYEG